MDEVENKDDSLLSALADAWDESESSDEESTQDAAPELFDGEASGAVEAQSEAQETGQAQEAQGEKVAPKPEDGQTADSLESPAPTQGADANAEVDLSTPPRSLSPTAREEWKNTPEAVKKEIAKREADFEAGIVKYSQDAQRARGMDQVLQPYQQLFAMNGGAPNVLPGLLQTASVLQMGTPQQRAGRIADLIKQFGVDIRMLDEVLVGQAPKDDPVQRAVNEAVAPYQQHMEQLQRQQAQQQQYEQQQVGQEISQFAADPRNEFYNDVPPGDLQDHRRARIGIGGQ